MTGSRGESTTPWRRLVEREWPLPGVEPLTTAAERYLTSPSAFRSMELTCLLVVEGEALRTADGQVDREGVASLVQPLWAPPDMRRRLVTPLVGLSAPVWVEAGTETRHEVQFREGRVPAADLAAAVREEHEAATDPRGPVVRARALDLDDGRVGLVMRAHHVAGDGLWAERAIRRVFTPQDTEEHPSPPVLGEGRRPGLPRAAVPLAVLLSWARRHPTAGLAWADWRRRPLTGRARRLVGRSLRPLRRFHDLDVDGRSVHLLAWSFRDVRARARADSSSVLALLALAAADAQSAAGGGPVQQHVLAAVPATGPGGEPSDTGPMRMQPLSVPPAGSAPGRGAAVHAQLRGAVVPSARVSGGGAPRALPPYVTLLPGFPRRLERSGVQVRQAYFLPAVDPRQQFGILGAATVDEFCVSVVADSEERGAHVVDALVDVLGHPRRRG